VHGHLIVFGESHLRRIVSLYASYYNEARTHLALAKDAPISRPIECCGRVIAEPMVSGLHHRYARSSQYGQAIFRLPVDEALVVPQALMRLRALVHPQ